MEQRMRVTLETVAKAIDGEIIGDGSIEITGVAGIREAREGELTFLANPR
jgi:UDP-3-O-[3-hydroxymyristoyl] glucosamine N-acyltransferase